MLLALSPLLTLALACGDASPDDSGDETAPDGGSGADAGAVDSEALVQTTGSATVIDDAFSGSEWTAVYEDWGDGAEVCRIRVDLVSTGPASDCPDCVWAFELQVTATEVELDQRCADAGLDAAAEGAKDRAYGYVLEYFGHSDVVMMRLGGVWQPVAYATWDGASGALEYSWDVGTVDLP